jgi:crossover junction endodeoxyribonuclease RuvC
MQKIILGLDPGIADTGYGLVEKLPGGKLKYIDSGSIKTPAGAAMPDRILFLAENLEKILDKYKPSLAAIEELFFCNNAKTAIVVGQARGVLLLVCRRKNLPIVEFTPLQVKQSICSYGKAEKKQVQKMVKLILNLKETPKPDDAADALAIAISAVNELNMNN